MHHPAYLHALSDLRAARWLIDHPPVDEVSDHRGRIHAAIDFLKKARADVAGEEDNGFANGLRGRAIGHIDAAIQAARRVFVD